MYAPHDDSTPKADLKLPPTRPASLLSRRVDLPRASSSNRNRSTSARQKTIPPCRDHSSLHLQVRASRATRSLSRLGPKLPLLLLHDPPAVYASRVDAMPLPTKPHARQRRSSVSVDVGSPKLRKHPERPRGLAHGGTRRSNCRYPMARAVFRTLKDVSPDQVRSRPSGRPLRIRSTRRANRRPRPFRRVAARTRGFNGTRRQRLERLGTLRVSCALHSAIDRGVPPRVARPPLTARRARACPTFRRRRTAL